MGLTEGENSRHILIDKLQSRAVMIVGQKVKHDLMPHFQRDREHAMEELLVLIVEKVRLHRQILRDVLQNELDKLEELVVEDLAVD